MTLGCGMDRRAVACTGSAGLDELGTSAASRSLYIALCPV